MKDINVFNFDLKKIKAEALAKDHEERIKYLKSVIIEYQVEKGIFDTAYGAGLRMPKKLSQSKFIHTIESEIEKSKRSIYAEESKVEKARLHFEEALENIEEYIPVIRENKKLKLYFIKKIEKILNVLDQ